MPNRDGSRSHVVEFFGDGDYTFDLIDKDWKILREIEEKCGTLMPLFHQISRGDYRVEHLREIIRWGLIGGGLTPQEAYKKVQTYFDMNPIADHWALALNVISAAVFGVDDDGKAKKDEASGE